MNLSCRTLSTSTCGVFRSTKSDYRNFQSRAYALSRFPDRKPGAGRNRSRKSGSITGQNETQPESPQAAPPTHRTESGLRGLLFRGNTLVIERQIEMLNVFAGFEQSNKYSITGEDGEPLGYIAEDPRGFLGTLFRQVFATHRPFRAVILDNQGEPILWLRRPFAWLNSRMFVQRLKANSECTPGPDPELDKFGEVQQIWHLWRRKYDLFLRDLPQQSSSSEMERGGPIQDAEATFYQVAKVDAGLLAWHFRLLDAGGNEVASIDRAFRGLGREVFTDTGRYSVQFSARELISKGGLQVAINPRTSAAAVTRELTLDERALFLALAVNIDFDYFSRHSHAGGGGLFHLPTWD